MFLLKGFACLKVKFYYKKKEPFLAKLPVYLMGTVVSTFQQTLFYQLQEEPTVGQISGKYVRSFFNLVATTLISERKLSWLTFPGKNINSTQLNNKINSSNVALRILILEKFYHKNVYMGARQWVSLLNSNQAKWSKTKFFLQQILNTTHFD